MVKHNNMVPRTNVMKYWQRFVRVNFNQPAGKKRRAEKRAQKAAKLAPRPAAGNLRPVVKPPSLRHNFRLRKGKGFTKSELKEAGIHNRLAPTIGISVDLRRRNKSVEGMQRNVDRLKEYMSKLVYLTNRKRKSKKSQDSRAKLKECRQNTHKHIIPIPRAKYDPARAITADDKKFMAFSTLRIQRAEQRLVGPRQKAKASKKEADN
mmetsp:Transcript_58282/g.127795  ORF Transcript_58282/g.127795 Transcript_58282/m.127795 type:complete len:207 (+) Transcript_58282:79-699(+)